MLFRSFSGAILFNFQDVSGELKMKQHLWGSHYRSLFKQLRRESFLDISRAIENKINDREAVKSLMKSEGLKVRLKK